MRNRALTTVCGSALVGLGAAILAISPAGAADLREAAAGAALPPSSPSASASASASATGTPATTASATASATASTPSATASATGTSAPSATATPSASATASADPSATGSVEPSATGSVDPSATGTPSPSPAASCPPGSTSSAAPSETADASATADPSASASASPSGGGGLPIPTLAPRLAAAQEPARDERSCRAATVTIATNIRQITAGNAPTLSGSVRDGRGDALEGATVTIYAKAYAATAYTAVATARTDAAGQYRVQVRPTKQTSYGANVGDARSIPTVISVYTRVNVTSPAPGASVSSPVTFTGGLVPGYARVAVGLGYLVNGRFVVLTQANTNADGGFAVTGRLPRGTYTFIVFTSAHQGTDKGAKSLRLTVR